MSEEQKGGKLDGIAIGGLIQRKTHWPAKEGKESSWSVEVAYMGGASFINVSESLYNRCGLGSYQLFRVTQRGGKEGKIYATAVE
jgi:hypothetical protein